jgi:putative cardiolipin synthase
MHNKSFTVDNRATVVGGRNVGNEYFGAQTEVVFADLDVLAIGPAVEEVSRVFDAYWRSASAYPAAKLLPAAGVGEGKALRMRWARMQEAAEAASYVEALRSTRLAHELLKGRLDFEWANARVVSDDPSKVLTDPEESETHLLPRLVATLGRPTRELDLVSPYFVPTEAGVDAFRSLGAGGVKVRILTNSLAATDVGAVHAGYAKRRVALLAGGARLYELKPKGERDDRAARGVGSSSNASLHAKTFAVDRERIFVGSFNFDPRSARLNTEMGLVIESPALASRLAHAFDEAIPAHAYQVELGADGRGLVWIERTAGGQIRHDSEPGVGALRRLGVELMSVLPIEWLL